VQVFVVDSSEPEAVRPRISAVESHPTLPEDFTTTNYVGEIKVDAAGRFVYVSNRGHNSIAVFAIDQTTGHLTPVGIQEIGGKCPRHFGLSPCGRFAVVGVQDSNVVRVFKICPNNGTLEAVQGSEYPFGSPCFVMVSTHCTVYMLSVGSILAEQHDIPIPALCSCCRGVCALHISRL
jgi:6-phosphogluconolactonase (cycloisomerase 2 family)